MDNMPRWLEDIKNGVDRDLDDDACHAEPPRTKNEIPAETRPPPPPPPPVAPDEAIVPIGDVVSVVGDVVVVQSLPNTPPLDEESILCLETRQGLAAIEEVFGPVAAPLYAFRAPSEVSGEGAEGGAEGGCRHSCVTGRRQGGHAHLRRGGQVAGHTDRRAVLEGIRQQRPKRRGGGRRRVLRR